ncbi:MAG: EAL domain-containing protein [Lysobacteraceae bacterium]
MSEQPGRVRIGLQARFFGLIAITLLLALVVMTLTLLAQRSGQRELAEIGRQGVRDMVEDAARQRVEAVALQLAENLVNPLYYFDLQGVGEIAKAALRQPDIAYALVFDAEGRIVHDGAGDIPFLAQRMDDAATDEGGMNWGTRSQAGIGLIESTVPVRLGDQELGGVRVGLSLAEPLKREAAALAAMTTRSQSISVNSLQWVTILMCALLALGALLLWLVGSVLVTPIRRLAEATRQVEAGDYDIHLPTDRGDELGELQRGFVRMAGSISRYNEEVRRLAYTDHLSGLPNRLALREHLEHRLMACRGSGQSLALLCVDLDDFKRVNDSLGHEAGDEALEQLALRLRRCVPVDEDPQALVARFGGDEFVAVLSGDYARELAYRFAEAVLSEFQHPLSVQGRQVFLGASIGITVFPDDADNGTDLVKNADIAMYQAKKLGKNCLRFYSRSMNHALESSVALEQSLRGAWERGELSLRFQPIQRLADGRMVGAEALLRWHHPQHGEVPPTTFIEIAEQSGLIEPIGRYVLVESCRAAREWMESGQELFVAVNVSARQLRRGDLPEQIVRILEETGLPPSRLHLELTETAVLGDEIQAGLQLARLRASGVKVWLDDFGTGFSGLSHLRRVPVDGLKIDRSFVDDILHDPDDLALTSAIIAMGHSLGIEVVAEGIENEAQLRLLRERGCEFGQGFWLGYPVSDADLRGRMVA